MCRATFVEEADSPVISAYVVLPRLEIGYEVPFLLDTGATATCISMASGFDSGIWPTLLPTDVEIIEQVSEGVGGQAKSYYVKEPTLLAFEEENENRGRYSLHVEHLPGIRVNTGTPRDLLGRDVLHNFDMEYSFRDGEVILRRDDYAGGRYQCFSSDEEISSSLFEFD